MDERVERLREDIVLFNRSIRTKVSGHLLTATQLQTLADLDRIGPMSARVLANVEQVTPQTVARTVAVLEEQGLLQRIPDPRDGRAQIISITEEGRSKLIADRVKRSEWLAGVVTEHCTDVEQDILFAAGKLLRRIAEVSASVPKVKDAGLLITS